MIRADGKVFRNGWDLFIHANCTKILLKSNNVNIRALYNFPFTPHRITHTNLSFRPSLSNKLRRNITGLIFNEKLLIKKILNCIYRQYYRKCIRLSREARRELTCNMTFDRLDMWGSFQSNLMLMKCLRLRLR